VDVIVLCEQADESPLGPIKIIVKSIAIEDFVDWFVGEEGN
jgi:predicted RNA binding protein with dsRBD fold (UPF0201 family)